MRVSNILAITSIIILTTLMVSTIIDVIKVAFYITVLETLGH